MRQSSGTAPSSSSPADEQFRCRRQVRLAHPERHVSCLIVSCSPWSIFVLFLFRVKGNSPETLEGPKTIYTHAWQSSVTRRLYICARGRNFLFRSMSMLLLVLLPALLVALGYYQDGLRRVMDQVNDGTRSYFQRLLNFLSSPSPKRFVDCRIFYSVRSNTCISYEAINRAFSVAREITRLSAPPSKSKELTDIETDVLGRTLVETSRILAKESVKFILNWVIIDSEINFIFVGYQTGSICRPMPSIRDCRWSTPGTRPSLRTAPSNTSAHNARSSATVKSTECATIWRAHTGAQ